MLDCKITVIEIETTPSSEKYPYFFEPLAKQKMNNTNLATYRPFCWKIALQIVQERKKGIWHAVNYAQEDSFCQMSWKETFVNSFLTSWKKANLASSHSRKFSGKYYRFCHVFRHENDVSFLRFFSLSWVLIDSILRLDV